ncbi:MAG: zinc finger domain-containing protein, partial [Candidatus Binatia bacterium]
LKALEQARSAGIIGHSLDAQVVFAIHGNQQGAKLSEWVNTDRARLQDLLIVSQADNGGESTAATNDSAASYDAPLLNCVVQVSKADGAKCERCWKYDVEIGADHNHPTVCPRCAGVLNAGAAA